MSRVPPLDPATLTAEQQRVAAAISGTRKNVRGPFTIWLRNPTLAEHANAFGVALRDSSTSTGVCSSWRSSPCAAPGRCNTPGRRTRRQAEAAGIAPDIVAAIRDNRKPDLKRDDERVVYEVATELMQTKELSQATYDRAIAQFGMRRHGRSGQHRRLLCDGRNFPEELRCADADRRQAAEITTRRKTPWPVSTRSPWNSSRRSRRLIHDEIKGNRPKLGGPFGVLLRNPALADGSERPGRCPARQGQAGQANLRADRPHRGAALVGAIRLGGARAARTGRRDFRTTMVEAIKPAAGPRSPSQKKRGL